MKRKTLTTALLAGLTGTVGIANMSGAVNLNPDGLGQTLIYPYYTVRDGYDTLVSVVNTTGQVKAVKVRFLEGKNSREVLDFNLYLSPFDIWTAAVVEDGTGGRMVTEDNSCTVPPIPAEGQPFLNFAYAGDSGGDTLDRTREGYLEMIEMGVVTNGGSAPWATFATHVAGVPADCGALVASWINGVWASNASDGMEPPTGGLFGGASVINVEGGIDGGYNADALDAFSAQEQHTSPGSVLPSLNSANSGFGTVQSIVFDNGSVVTSEWNRGADAVSAIYMHDRIMNEFILDEATLSGTDWVVTFPTKRFYVDPFSSGSPDPVPPFTTVFPPSGTACEVVSLNIWDREERTTIGEINFSPLPPEGANVLCFEVNVLTFDNSDVLGSTLSENVPSQGFENGWLRVSFQEPGNQMTSADGDTYFGLPVTGFALQTFTNGTLDLGEGPVLSNYAGLFDHRATRNISAGTAVD